MLRKKKAPPFYQLVKTNRKYQAIGNQSGTNPIISSIITEEIKGVVCTRVSPGVFRFTWPEFNTTINTMTFQSTHGHCIMTAKDLGLGYIEVQSYNVFANAAQDGLIDDGYFEITAYTLYSE